MKSTINRTKAGLIGYLHALHWQLEREFHYQPEELERMDALELKAETNDLADHLSRCLGGEDAVERARENAWAAWADIAFLAWELHTLTQEAAK